MTLPTSQITVSHSYTSVLKPSSTTSQKLQYPTPFRILHTHLVKKKKKKIWELIHEKLNEFWYLLGGAGCVYFDTFSVEITELFGWKNVYVVGTRFGDLGVLNMVEFLG